MGNPTDGYSQNENRAWEAIWRRLPDLVERIAVAEERQADALEKLANEEEKLRDEEVGS